MPATRRSRTSSGPITKGGQKSLSFNQSKITKPSPKDEKKPLSASTKQSFPPTVPIDVGHVSSESAVAAQAAAELDKPEPTPEELRAASITDAQIAKYWKAREAERRTPRVHLEGVSVEERVLRLFDMSSQFGVGIGFLYDTPMSLCFFM
jgi:DNA polymerase delta subunit 4